MNLLHKLHKILLKITVLLSLSSQLFGQNDSSVLKIKLSSGIEFPVPSNRYQRYLSFIDKEMLLGLRPEKRWVLDLLLLRMAGFMY